MKWGSDCMQACSHTATEAKHQVKRRLFLDVVVRKGTAVFKLFACKNQTLLIRRNPLLVLNFGFDIVDGIACFHVKSDRLASERFHENLHTSAEPEYKVQSGLFLNVVVG